MMTSIDTTSLFLGVLFSAIGFGYFIYGKRQSNTIVRYAGIGLMIFPYFMSHAMAMIVLGLVLMLLPKIL